MRSDRRKDLLRILHQGNAHSQSDIVEELRAAGHDVTQATVSRDLRQIGALKVKVGEKVVYRLIDDLPKGMHSDLVARNLFSTLRDFAVDIEAAASLVVVHTAPGHASAVARAIDLAGAREVVGTVAGDDTIFIATPGDEIADEMCALWRAQSFGEGEEAS